MDGVKICLSCIEKKASVPVLVFQKTTVPGTEWQVGSSFLWMHRKQDFRSWPESELFLCSILFCNCDLVQNALKHFKLK